MPKRANMKKNAAAACQNWQAIENAKKNGGLFGAVIKRLGNGGFQVQLQLTGKGRLQVQASPRGLFTNGSMKITVGHVVLLSGELMPVGSQQRPLEIVGRLDNKAEIRDLIRSGHMPASVLAIADSASATESAQVAQDDLFESDDSDEDFWVQGVADVRGGLKAERKAQETAATIAARVASLKGARSAAASGLKRKGMDGGVDAGDLADPLLFSDPEYQRFNRWRAHKESAVKMAGGGSVAAAAPLAAPSAVASQTVEELMALFRLEQETARMAAEQAAIAAREDAAARTVALRAELAGQTVKDNWDDEDLVDINDL
jgi:hypothetical protein